MSNLGVYSCDDNGNCENTLTYNPSGGYAIPIGTPTDKPIYSANPNWPAPTMTGASVIVIAVAVFALFVIGGRR